MLDVLWTVHVGCIVDCTCWMYCGLYMLDVLWTVHVGCIVEGTCWMYCGLYMLDVRIVDCTCWMYCGLYVLDVLWTVHVGCTLNAHKLYVHTCTLYPLYVLYLVPDIYLAWVGGYSLPLANVLCNTW